MSSTVVQWIQNLADGIRHNRFLDYQVNTGLYGIPVATFGLVTIAAAVFVHATFSDEITAIGGQVYDAAQQGFNRASEMVEASQVAVSEQVNRIEEAISAKEEPPPPVQREEEEKEEEEPRIEGGGGRGGRGSRRRRRKTNRKRT